MIARAQAESRAHQFHAKAALRLSEQQRPGGALPSSFDLMLAHATSASSIALHVRRKEWYDLASTAAPIPANRVLVIADFRVLILDPVAAGWPDAAQHCERDSIRQPHARHSKWNIIFLDGRDTCMVAACSLRQLRRQAHAGALIPGATPLHQLRGSWNVAVFTVCSCQLVCVAAALLWILVATTCSRVSAGLQRIRLQV